MDDALVRCALDLSARPYLVWGIDLPTERIGSFDCELLREFFQALSAHGGIDHQEQMIARIGDDQIVHNAARVIGKECVARFAFGQFAQSGWH